MPETKEVETNMPGEAADLNLPPHQQAASLKSKDLLSIENLDANEINLILDTAHHFKEISERPIKKVPTLRGKSIINLFFEPSPRTRMSFLPFSFSGFFLFFFIFFPFILFRVFFFPVPRHTHSREGELVSSHRN